MNRDDAHYATAFGLRWISPVPLHLFAASTDRSAAHIQVHRKNEVPPAPHAELLPARNVEMLPDGIRYHDGWDAALTMETNGRNSVTLYAGECWPGVLPAAFFSTVTALLLARRGLLPMHGSAVEVEGEAVLICGRAGAGKSTYAASLIARGARLLSDDLTILHPEPRTGALTVFTGRTTMRLHPETARRLGQHVPWRAEPFVAAGKIAVSPPRVESTTGVPLRKVVLLGCAIQPLTPGARLNALAAHFFRPFWLRKLEGQLFRRIALSRGCEHVTIETSPAFEEAEKNSLHTWLASECLD